MIRQATSRIEQFLCVMSPFDRIVELRGAAALWREQVGEPDGARAAYESILQIDAAHDEAFLELEKLHTAASRWEPLVELYLARLGTREEEHGS